MVGASAESVGGFSGEPAPQVSRNLFLGLPSSHAGWPQSPVRTDRQNSVPSRIWEGMRKSLDIGTVRIRRAPRIRQCRRVGMCDENPGDPAVQRKAFARAVRSRLGELRGEINGQQIKVYRKKIRELTVWIPDGLINWGEPISRKVNGRQGFEGRLERDLFVSLSQAARTYDFDRLRWAGLRFKSGARTKVIAGQTPFPEPEFSGWPAGLRHGCSSARPSCAKQGSRQ